MFLNFREDGHNRNCNTKNQVEADEDLVFCAVVRLGVEDVEQRSKDDGEDVKRLVKDSKAAYQSLGFPSSIRFTHNSFQE